MEEFENKKWFRCVYVNLKLKEEVSIPHTSLVFDIAIIFSFSFQKELNLYVDKNGTIQDLLDEAKKEVKRYLLLLFFFLIQTYCFTFVAKITFNKDSTKCLRYVGLSCQPNMYS